YAFFAEQRVRDLEQIQPEKGAARDAHIKDLKTAAFWFHLTPAGRRVAEHAATMFAEDEAERQALREANELAAEKLAMQHRKADEMVHEGLKLVRSGDLPRALDKLREGLASYPTSSPSASRAAKAVSDVETYLAAGRKLLDEAKEMESQDPDGAFRLRLKALRDFELHPDVKALKLALRIETVPPEAKLLVRGDPQEYLAPIGISVGGRGMVAVEARAQGFLSRTLSLGLP